MWEIISSWSWVTKMLIAAILVSPFTTCVAFFSKQFGIRPGVFLLGWMIGNMLAVSLFVRTSGTASQNAATPSFFLLLIPVIVGFTIGGMANVLYAQSILAASNPGLPPALFSVSTPIAYTLSFCISKIFPNQFPVIEFNWINFAGVIVLILGLVLVTHRSS